MSNEIVVRRPRRRQRQRQRRTAATLIGVGGVLLAVVVVADPSVAVANRSSIGIQPATPAFSARRSPDVLLAVTGRRKANETLVPVLKSAPPASCVLLQDGDTEVASVRADTPLAPASTMKVLTASVALDVLPKGTTFSTRVLGPAPDANGVVNGDVTLVGGGDPLLTTETGRSRFTNGPQPSTSFERLADDLVAAGITSINGSVVGDGSRHDGTRSLPGWPARF
ncbi:MAG: D-alanyl-D-alanine carboxypeptidase, partial [Actinomycetes bacterium]